MSSRPVCAKEIENAVSIIDPDYLNSPLLRDTSLDAALSAEVLLKVESLNPIRSFKGRGADLLIAGLQAPGRLVCASAGNFGQGVARAGLRRGREAVVFAAENASPVKIDAMRRFGAEVRLAGADFDAAKAAALDFAAGGDATFIEDGAHPAIAEGAGTMAYEMTQAGAAMDAALVPVGNGSLIAGVGAWLKHADAKIKVIGVVAEGAPAMKLSFDEGKIVTTPRANTIADGVAVREPVAYALECMRESVDEVVLVSDEAIIEAMRRIHRALGLVIEPAGAAGLAALLAQRERWRGKRVATILCGGNMTPEQMKAWL